MGGKNARSVHRVTNTIGRTLLLTTTWNYTYLNLDIACSIIYPAFSRCVEPLLGRGLPVVGDLILLNDLLQ